ncbi:MAG: dihydrodipicolinate synthase family protein, partial [Rhodospirillales bacterium]|nr:dihydrodipicolinate synthase family protein [Rhodospirillales bacterium]
SGADGTALPLTAAGGHGCISVTANSAPRLCADMQKAWRNGDIAQAIELQAVLMPVHMAMFCETSPGPVKYAAELLGLCSANARLPICEIADSSKEAVLQALTGAGILS